MNSRLQATRCSIIGSKSAPDRLLASGTLLHTTALHKPPILLAYLFEVTKPWFPESRLLAGLIDTLNTEYSSLQPDKDLGNQFEGLLQRLNQFLNQLSETGETDWIGNLNGLVACVYEDQLLFSQTGHCPTYLLQRGRIRQITEESGEEQTHPLKTFANLASGTLQADDRVLIANPELYREISLDALRRVVGTNSPYLACQHIVRQLKQNRNPSVYATILSISENAVTPNNEPLEILLDEVFEPKIKRLQRKATPVFHAVHLGAKRGYKLAEDTTKTKILPSSREVIKKGVSLAQQLPAYLPKKPVQIASSVEVIVPTNYQKKTGIAQLPLAQIQQWWSIPSHKKGIALVLTACLIVVAGISASSRIRTANHVTASVDPLLKQVQILSDAAGTAIQTKQLDSAVTDIQSGKKLLAQIKGSAAQLLSEKLSLQEDLISQTSRLTPTQTYALTTPGSSLLEVKPFIYVAAGNTILRIREGAPSDVLSIPLPNSSDSILDLTANDDPTAVGYLLTKNEGVFRIIQADSLSTLRPITPTTGTFITSATRITSYKGNVYLLDSMSGSLWRYSNTGTTYSMGVAVLNPKCCDISGSISVAIDGSIYVLDATSQVRKFTAGKLDTSFVIKNLPPLTTPFTKATQLITDANNPYLYLFDAGNQTTPSRLVALSKVGTFSHNLGFPKTDTDVRAVSINPADKSLLLLTATSVQQFLLP